MTVSLDILNDTFRCDRFGLIPVRGCLRRQIDRQESTKSGELGPPRRAFCADTCGVGASYRASARDAGIHLEPCPACGSALIGPDATPCATCAARRLDAGKDVPRGALPTVAPSARLWTGEVPDVPISPPGQAAAGHRPNPSRALYEQRERAAAARREALRAEEQDHQEEPAEPAEEERMACKECGSKTCHKGWCTCRPGGPLKGAKRGPGAAKAPAAKPAPVETKAAAARRLQRVVTVSAEAVSGLGSVPLDELLRRRAEATATVVAVDGELRRRQREIAEALGEPGRTEAA